MDSKQAIFTEDYCNTLRLKLKAGHSISNYTLNGESFEYTEKDVCYLNDFHVDKEKLTKLNTENLSLWSPQLYSMRPCQTSIHYLPHTLRSGCISLMLNW